MFRFSIATLMALPLVLASVHVALVRPVELALFFGVVGALFVIYALTFEQKSNYLDAANRPVFIYFSSCLVICVSLLFTLQLARKVSSQFDARAYEYRMKSLGYRKVYTDSVRDTNGGIKWRRYKWER
jgi:hypothetical protein